VYWPKRNFTRGPSWQTQTGNSFRLCMKRSRGDLLAYPTALVAQGAGGVARLIRGPRALFPCQVAGPALPCRCAPGDNLALHRAILRGQPGVVIVCDAQGRDNVASFGELMALDCARRKIAGVVIYGAVRDTAALEEIGFPVFCMAQCPLSPAKKRAGVVGKTITLGGVRVEAGDEIIADWDGVLLVPAARWPAALTGIRDVQVREREVKRRLRAGEFLGEIIGLKK
jgi:4-hydroxy-4-methyl-2-oxoglutarate aldolase